jgi:hypothetical protein
VEKKMGQQLASDDNALSNDLIWGVASIAAEIGRNSRQTFHMLENGKLPAAKNGGRWVASRSGLRRHFAALIAGATTEGRPQN